jgi:hypothetical protein
VADIKSQEVHAKAHKGLFQQPPKISALKNAIYLYKIESREEIIPYFAGHNLSFMQEI